MRKRKGLPIFSILMRIIIFLLSSERNFIISLLTFFYWYNNNTGTAVISLFVTDNRRITIIDSTYPILQWLFDSPGQQLFSSTL